MKEKTPLEIEREKEYEKFKGKFNFIVRDILPFGIVESEFDNLESTLHKLKLDLITMVKTNGQGRIEIELRKVI